MPMKPHSCLICEHHKQVRKGIEETEDGPTVIYDHYCQYNGGNRLLPAAELHFGCGLFEERYNGY